MKIIESNEQYYIYGGDSVSTHDELPAGFYEVQFQKQQGFWLTKHPAMQVKEDKVYGDHSKKINKVLNAFNTFNRNLGVMLSGDKGMGKSLFARMLGRVAVNKGLPVIIVNFYTPGIMNYINSIDQEVLILFDEFDKTFEVKEDFNPQYEVLNVLDGLGVGKKLFVFICNDLDEINDCMLNRPGRIHYHFRFSYPNEAEVTAYLMDKLDKQYYNQIEKVVKFSCMTKINYDCLRAIAFELNNGYEFEESINDLNILHLDDSNSYCTVEVTYKNEKVFRRSLKFNLFDPNESTIIWATDKGSRPIGEVKIAFNNVDIDMAKHKEYFATISDLRIESLDLYRAYEKEERLELENYYLDSDNIVMACIKKDSDKNKNKRFF